MHNVKCRISLYSRDFRLIFLLSTVKDGIIAWPSPASGRSEKKRAPVNNCGFALSDPALFFQELMFGSLFQKLNIPQLLRQQFS
jgi:hypothetical protein